MTTQEDDWVPKIHKDICLPQYRNEQPLLASICHSTCSGLETYLASSLSAKLDVFKDAMVPFINKERFRMAASRADILPMPRCPEAETKSTQSMWCDT